MVIIRPTNWQVLLKDNTECPSLIDQGPGRAERSSLLLPITDVSTRMSILPKFENWIEEAKGKHEDIKVFH